MSTIRVPAPLRAYTEGQHEVSIEAETVSSALGILVNRYPNLSAHLFDEHGQLRPYINVFINEQDVRDLQGIQTSLEDSDRLMILPSIAGGHIGHPASGGLRAVDHNALRANQTAIIALLLAAFIADADWLAAAVGVIMFIGTALGVIGFAPFYRLLRASGRFVPDIIPDHPEPHRFAQGFGGVVLIGTSAALAAGLNALGWTMAWLVIALAGLNLFAGFCVGCALYYWFNRLGLPGFRYAPPPGTPAGRRPRRASD